MFKTQDRSKLKRFLAKKPTPEVVLPAASAAPSYQQPKPQLPRQQKPKQLEEASVDKNDDEPRKLKQKKKVTKTVGDENDQIPDTPVVTTKQTKVQPPAMKKNQKKFEKKQARKEKKKADQPSQAEKSKPTTTPKEPKKPSKLQLSLSRDVASMIAAFNDKGYVEDDDDDEDFDNIDDPEDEVYEEEGEQDFEEGTDKIEPPAKKQKKEVIITTNNSKTNKKEPEEVSRRSSELGAKARQTLATSMFRSLNESLYTKDSKESRKSFSATQFRLYHEAYDRLAAEWPLRPVDYLIEVLKKRLTKKNKSGDSFIIADVGCGTRAQIAEALATYPHTTVYSYDLYSNEEGFSGSTNNNIIAADMSRLPLDSGTVDIVVYSLSLMPTNLKDVLREANRVLKPNSGQMLIVEVASRFADYQSGVADRRGANIVSKKKMASEEGAQNGNPDQLRFAGDLKPYGFKLTESEQLPPNGFFVFLSFKKTANVEELTVKSRLPEISLKACLYKAR